MALRIDKVVRETAYLRTFATVGTTAIGHETGPAVTAVTDTESTMDECFERCRDSLMDFGNL